MAFNRFEVKSTHVCETTLVGVLNTNFPLSHGNCFSMSAENGKHYRIANFVYENLNELFKRGLTVPVNLLVIGDYTALIYDERISNKWYLYKYCTICCPKDLLPDPQQLELERDHRAGIRIEHGDIITINQDNRL
jgi:hypothetical protein